MAGTRSSTRIAGQPKSSPSQPKDSPKATAGSKRKSEATPSPSAKRGRKSAEKKEQKTIEETMEVDRPDKDQDDNILKENGKSSPTEKDAKPNDTQDSQETKSKDQTQLEQQGAPTTSDSANEHEKEQIEQQTTNGHQAEASTADKAEDASQDKAAPQPPQTTSKMDDTGKIEPQQEPKAKSQQEKDTDSTAQTEDAVQPHDRDEETPSSILEKGVIYFFFRGRVGIDNPSDVNDIARSYMILRPIPHGAKIGEGVIGDGHGKCRLLALPKKVLPVSGKDRFMTFVEKSKTTFKELKEDFMSASDYATKTAGVRHTPTVTPVAEGVYAMTTTGRESHLAYMITIPNELGEVQKDMGIREQGSFITSTKNPQYAGPANTNLPQGPDFPKEILDEFRSLRWAPLQPKYLDYENTQFLLIGESSGIDGATEQQPADDKADKPNPKEELEKLEGEDEIRVKHLKGDDAVFADLGISKKDYPQVPSTWHD